MSTFKQIWDFLWNSDSAWSWVTDFILAFLIVRFIFFPVLSMALGTPLPLVVVESGSMEHNNLPFDYWWAQSGSFYENLGITKEQFQKFPLSNGFYTGDIIISMGEKNYERGDIIIFNTPSQSTPIIHRIMYQNSDLTFATKGDHNAYQLPQEKSIPRDAIVSKAVFIIPKLGWLKLFFVNLLNGFK